MTRSGSLFLSLGFVGCTSFADVRSAEVFPGPQLDLGVAASTPPGDDAAWFWSFGCAHNCNRRIVGTHAALRWGQVPRQGGLPFEVGGGVSGIYPYVTGYVQLKRTGRPFGVGVRIGVPDRWREDAIFARYDVTSGRTRWVFTPTLFLEQGSSGLGTHPGRLLAFAPALGVQVDTGGSSPVTVWLSPVIARANRGLRTFGGDESWTNTTSAFLVAGLSLTFKRTRAS